MVRLLSSALVVLAVAGLAPAAEKYMGPRPPKSDIPYLVHADNLIETEAGIATTETRKDASIAVLKGATSPAKTPLAEPIFIIRTEKFSPEKFEAYKLEAKDGQREVMIGHKKPKNVQRPIHLAITRLDDRLYRIEVDEPLENGEYTLTPQGSDDTFSFSIH
jgi:hypothetical protein